MAARRPESASRNSVACSSSRRPAVQKRLRQATVERCLDPLPRAPRELGEEPRIDGRPAIARQREQHLDFVVLSENGDKFLIEIVASRDGAGARIVGFRRLNQDFAP